MEIRLHAYHGTTTPLFNFLNVEINLHDQEDTVNPDPDCVNYWLAEVSYEHSTRVENIVPRGFFNGTPNSIMVITLSQEGLFLGPDSYISERIDNIIAQVPYEQIMVLVNSHHQTTYLHEFYPELTNIVPFNYLELCTRSLLPTQVARQPENYRRFLFLNRRNCTHRTFMFNKLWRDRNFVENSYTSFNPGSYWEPNDRMPDGTLNFENASAMLNGVIRDLRWHVPDIATWLPAQTFPQLPERYSSQNPFDYNFFSAELAQAHADTDINVIVESNAYRIPQKFFSTEKLYRTIASSQAFIVYAQPGYYSNLRQLGYATYERLFNERHDSIEDDFERGSVAARAIIQLSRMESGAFEKTMQMAQRIKRHNYETFMKRTSLATLALGFTGPAAPLVKYLRYSPF